MKNTLKYYLAGYNLVAFLFGAAYLLYFIASGLRLDPFGVILLDIAQGLALLEIIHAIFKWVKSPVLSTAAQVASRILVVVLINKLPVFGSITWDITAGHGYSFMLLLGVIVVSFAWGITELVRYSLYFLSLVDLQPRWLLWARYSFFIVLYPCGVTGEWLIILSPIVALHFPLNAYSIFAIFLFGSYAYYFPVLYGYMWKQRKVKL